ncbi:hypothetical protein WCP94_003569 [Bilophila wadsworthia]
MKLLLKIFNHKENVVCAKRFFACLTEIDCSTKQIHATVSSHAEFCLSSQKGVK